MTDTASPRPTAPRAQTFEPPAIKLPSYWFNFSTDVYDQYDGMPPDDQLVNYIPFIGRNLYKLYVEYKGMAYADAFLEVLERTAGVKK